MIDNNIKKISVKKFNKFQSSNKQKQLYKNTCFLWLRWRTSGTYIEYDIYFYNSKENDVNYIGHMVTPYRSGHYPRESVVNIYLSELIYNIDSKRKSFSTLIEAKQFVRRTLTNQLLNDTIRYKELKKLL